MLIGILSDSHDNRPAVGRAAALFKAAGCGLVVHAGDFVAPFAARELEVAGCPVRAVFGNCDGEKGGLEAALTGFGVIRKAPFGFAWGGLRFLVSHLDAPVAAYIKEKKYDIIIYGHTHKTEIRRAGRALVVNPGEAGGWLSGRSTVALLDTERLDAEIVGI
jgi:putative phosphoesterase